MTCSSCVAQDLLTEAESLLGRRELDAALAAFHRAEADGADADRCSSGRWMVSMLRGDFEAAWLESDAIRSRGAYDPHRFWHGEDLRGKTVIVLCLHGLGDALQFLRYMPFLKAVASRVLLEVPPALLELAHFLDGTDCVFTWGEQRPAVPKWDVQVEVTVLPYLFRTQLHQLPLADRYLQLPRQRSNSIDNDPRRIHSIRVGIVWSSGEWNRTRSVPLPLLRSLLNTPGCEFWNLQGGRARCEWDNLESSPALHDAPECANSVLGLAELMAQLDLVITPDTLAAHLAGAIGLPTWMMLQKVADWRWMVDREDSPWYPTMRLSRQKTQGDWAPVVNQLRGWLRALADPRANENAI